MRRPRPRAGAAFAAEILSPKIPAPLDAQKTQTVRGMTAPKFARSQDFACPRCGARRVFAVDRRLMHRLAPGYRAPAPSSVIREVRCCAIAAALGRPVPYRHFRRTATACCGSQHNAAGFLRYVVNARRCVKGDKASGARYCARPFSQLRPSNGLTVMDSMLPSSMQRAFTLTPSGCERGM